MQKVEFNGRSYRLTLKGWLLAWWITFCERLKRTGLVAWCYRKRYPHESTCYHCGLPWSALKSDIHDIQFPGSIEGFFTCCETCWQKMSYDEKMESVKDLYLRWSRLGGSEHSLGEMYQALDFDEMTHEVRR